MSLARRVICVLLGCLGLLSAASAERPASREEAGAVAAASAVPVVRASWLPYPGAAGIIMTLGALIALGYTMRRRTSRCRAVFSLGMGAAGTISVLLGVSAAHATSIGYSSTQFLTAGPDDLAVTASPDGSRLAFTRSGQLWIARADGSDQRRIELPFPHGVSFPDWSPSGDFLAVTASPTGNPSDTSVHIVDLSDATTRQVTTAGAVYDPDFSPDGQRLAYMRSGINDERIHIVGVDGTADHPVTASGVYSRHPVWSPDGTQIAYRRYPSDPYTASKIHVMLADGTADRALATSWYETSWSPDGRFLAVATGRGLEAVAADGSGTTLQLTLGATQYYGSPEWSHSFHKIFAVVGPGSAGPYRLAQVLIDHKISVSGASFQGVLNEPLTRSVAEIADDDVSSEADNFTVTIDWGDGTSSPGTVTKVATGRFTVTGTHTYPISSSYTVRTSVRSREGSSAAVSATANIYPHAVPSVPPQEGPQPPAGPIGVSINAGSRYTNDPDVALQVVWPRGATSLLISGDGGFATARIAPVAAVVPWTLDTSGPERLPKTVYVRFAGSTQNFTDDIILDETRPAIVRAELASASEGRAASAAASRPTRHRIRIQARDPASGVGIVQAAAAKRRPFQAVPYRKLVTVRGARRPRYVRVRDRAGNWSRWRALQ